MTQTYDPLTVAVLSGGRSSEHEVSLASGQAVARGLEAAGHVPLEVVVARDGSWSLDGREVTVTPGRGLLGAGVVFPVLHGPYGEDGTIQGLLDCLDVPYVGAGVRASAICLDKVLFKRLMGTADIPQVDFVSVQSDRWRSDPDAVVRDARALGLPVFVKPARLGSSVGIARAAGEEELRRALDGAFAHDSLVIVEALAGGVEVECSVLGAGAGHHDGAGGPALASEPGEIVLSGGWYDYGAKYSEGGMQLRVPARISEAAAARVRQLAVQAFVLSGCEGLARADFFVDGDRVLLNELNTMPGFTPTSVYARLMEASGIGYPELLDRLCRLALERHAGAHAYVY